MIDIPIININDYHKLNEIGSGSFGIVYLVEDKKTYIEYAAKEELTEEYKDDSNSKSSLIKELKSYVKVSNYAILILIGYSPINFEGINNKIIITQYMPKGSLDKMLKNSHLSLAPPQYTFTSKYIILLGVALGMKYLHSKGIIHRDLKPANILLDNVLHPHICDFGCSKVSDKKLQDIIMKSGKGTPLYMAPEIYNGDHYDYKVDVYAYSIIFYEVVTDRLPFTNIKSEFHLQNIVIEGNRPNLTYITNEDIQRFLNSCWSNDPKDRPTFSQIVDFLMQDKIRKFFNVCDEEVDDFLDNFEDDLKDSRSFAALNIKLEADNGSIEAMMQYARILIEGIGTDIDVEEGIRYYKKASELGCVNAMFNLGYLLSSHPKIEHNIEEAINYYEKAIEKGNADSAHNLSVMYHDGIGIPVDKEKAAYYAKIAADLGDEIAQFNYGYMLLTADGIPMNKQEAAYYFRMSSEKGNTDSMNLLAEMLMKGDGIPTDKNEAARIYKMSADKGDKIAMFQYGQLLLFGDEIKGNKKEAAKYLKMSADQGFVDASIHYADMLYNGDGIDVDLDEAAKYLKQPIEGGYSKAMYMYAGILHKKNGMGPFPIESVKYIKKAADLGDGDACLTYSNILRFGTSVPRNIEEANKYLKMAADKGNKNALSLFKSKTQLSAFDSVCKSANVDKTQAFNALNDKMTDSNDIEMIAKMAMSYDEGFLLPKNKSLAAKYYKIAADKGHVESMYLYARLLRHGEGVPRDINESIKYYKNAASKGHDRAMINLGHIYYKGEIGTRNCKEAVYYYKMAADHGNTNAKFMYGQLLFNGEGIKMNKEEGLKFIKKADDEGCKMATIFLKGQNKSEGNQKIEYAKYYYEENNYNDRRRADALFKEAADEGDAEAMLLHAKMSLYGDGIEPNKDEAIKYLDKAVNNGNREAMRILGGLMLHENKNEAFRYLRLAANHGDLFSSFLIKFYFHK
ncbi:hypothetical protein M9Y10_032110 [Tritrichomonas musculus]|uniref:Protein kinase domain-containing protein n=1 Tax=Tritrichomonas musculus TaxID=1915356 RepID=A0ABR2GZ10_9EUKA